MAITKSQKEEIINSLVKDFEKSKSVVFAKYDGIGVNDIKKVRRNLLDNDSRFRVSKKTLISIAAKKSGIEEKLPKDVLEGQVATVFSFADEVTAPKLVSQMHKEYKNLEITGGVLEGRVLPKAEMIELASLPSREVLIAKLLGAIQSPSSGFVSVLSGVMRGFVSALSELEKKKAEQES